jgi:serine protease AprX
MAPADQILRDFATHRDDLGRFTQDTPVLPDVWLAFANPRRTSSRNASAHRVDVLMTPERHVDPARLAFEVNDRLGHSPDTRVSFTTRHVVAALTIEELLLIAVPLSAWGERLRGLAAKRPRSQPRHLADAAEQALLQEREHRQRRELLSQDDSEEASWLARLVAGVMRLRDMRAEGQDLADFDIPSSGPEVHRALLLIVHSLTSSEPADVLLWRVTRNRPAFTASEAARAAVKADAATRLFDIDCSNLAWAIIDKGIDARHIAFRTRTATGSRFKRWRAGNQFRSCVVKTYDLTRLRDAHSAALYGILSVDPATQRILSAHGPALQAVGDDLLHQRPLDWGRLAPLLEITATAYEPPTDDHGTHVASVLAGDWAKPAEGDPVVGICPGLRLYDLRVFDSAGNGDEFTVSAALQFIDYLNGYGRAIEIAGANVSLSVPYDFEVFGCGQTPVCVEADRLVDSGVVVVAAAGNRGTEHYDQDGERIDGFRMISLTDPGNAQNVITVGSTHATDPYAYGVSFFSSRGPTGDGRAKPDLVAPGEKIDGAAIGDKTLTLDGTSQAAAYVSGAAALLLGRHRELIGKPDRVKTVLMETANDLGRTREFQGGGLVDVLRAIQSV